MTAPKSLKDFVTAQRMKDCRICSLPPEILQQIQSARSQRRVTRTMILQWLREEHHIDITAQEMDAHYRGVHRPETVLRIGPRRP